MWMDYDELVYLKKDEWSYEWLWQKAKGYKMIENISVSVDGRSYVCRSKDEMKWTWNQAKLKGSTQEALYICISL